MTVYAIALTGADQTITMSGRKFAGYAVKENAAGTAAIAFYDGTSTAGIYLGGTPLIANQKFDNFISDPGILLTSGSLFIDIESGTIVGSVLVGAE